MALVKDTLSWDTPADQAAFYAYAGITDGADAARDVRLGQWYLEATYVADWYLQNPFTDDDGADVAQPPTIESGVWEYVRACDDYYTSTLGSTGSPAALSVKTGQLAETYGAPSGGTDTTPMGKIALEAAAPKWHWSSLRGIIKGIL